MTERQYKKDEVIFHQGDEGNTFYQVVDGTVGIYADYDGNENVKLSEIKKGELFGEIAVINAVPRTGSAVALEDGTTLKEFSVDELKTYFEEEPENVVLMIKTLSKRLRDLTAEYDKAKEEAQKLNAEEGTSREETRHLFKKYTYYEKVKPADPAKPSAETVREEKSHTDGFAKNVVSYPKGTVICKEGDNVQCMYDIHWGRVGIYSNYGTPEQVELTTLAANQFFGEMGMVDNAPRSATAVALDDDTTVEIIYPGDFAELFEKNPLKVNMILAHLSARLRSLTLQYGGLCEKIAQKLG